MYIFYITFIKVFTVTDVYFVNLMYPWTPCWIKNDLSKIYFLKLVNNLSKANYIFMFS